MDKIAITIILLIEITMTNHDYSSLGQKYVYFTFLFFNMQYVNNVLMIMNIVINVINYY